MLQTFLFGGLNRLVIGLKAVRVGFTLANVACKGFLGWAFALATAAWAVYENWDTVKAFLMKIWEPIEPYWNSFKNTMTEYGKHITKAWTVVKDFFSSIWNEVTPYWDKFKSKAGELGITDGIINAWTKVKNFFLQIWNKISPIIDKITKPLSNLWDGAKSSVQKIGNLFSSSKSSSPQLKIPREIKPANSNITRNQSNNFSITINANKNDNPEMIANKVMNRVSDYSKTFLYDEVAEAI